MKFLNKIDGADKLITDSQNRLVSDTEKTTWNSKQNALGFTPIKNTGDTITGGDLYMDGGSVNYIRPVTTGGWARGFWWSQRDKTRIGGIGVLGSGDSVSKFYIGYGVSPWSSSILEAFPSYVNIGGDLRKQGKTVATEEFVNNKVKTDVPADAKFTDTVYTHPSTHPASIITESTSRRFVSDTEKTTWDGKTKIITSATEPSLETGDQWHKIY